MQTRSLYINVITDYDWLIALEFGRVDDGQSAECWEGVSESFGFLRDRPGGEILGFKVLGLSAFDPESEEVDRIWEAPLFNAPVLGLRSACAGEIVLAARALFGGEDTINRRFFDAATAAEGEDALGYWLACLQAGDSMAHFGLGYTLHELGRHQEAYRHLRHYTEIAPSGAWSWCWLGRAASALGEIEEARAAYEQAIEFESEDGEATDAPELLAELNGSRSPDARAGVGRAQRIRGCLLGGAIGDALGAPVEFSRRAELIERFGREGVRRYLDPDGRGRITDDTQMTLFTAEGMIRARLRGIEKGIQPDEAGVIDHAYARWLTTQGHTSGRWETTELDGWLLGEAALHVARAPGNTCVGALRGAVAGSIEAPINDSKGCGAPMRAAPVGMAAGVDSAVRFRLGAEVGALTHGHPSGYLAAGFLAATIGALIDGADLDHAIRAARNELLAYPDHAELLGAVDLAVESARQLGLPEIDQIEAFGAGWVAEEALGISLWIALTCEDPLEGLAAAVTHGGDSDSTGAITGNLLGAALGERALPSALIERLAERGIIESIADDVFELLAEEFVEITPALRERYPGW